MRLRGWAENFYFFLRNLFFRQPIYANILLTHRCNLRCFYCNTWKARVPELGFNEWKKILDKLRRLGVIYVGFTGGEPLLHPDVFKILNYAVEKGFIVGITSNGTLPLEKYERLIETGVHRISISLDGLKESLPHFKSSKKILETVKFLKENKKRGQLIEVQSVISDLNKGLIEDVIKSCMRLGVSWVFQLVSYCSEEMKGYLKAESSYAKSLTFRFCLKNYFFSSNTLSYTIKSYLYTKKHKKLGCKAGVNFIAIDSNGNLCACQDFCFATNFLNTSLKEKEIKDKFKEVRRGCKGCTYICYFRASNIYNPLFWLDFFVSSIKSFAVRRVFGFIFRTRV